MKYLLRSFLLFISISAVACASGSTGSAPKSARDSIQVATAEAAGWNVTPNGKALYEQGLRQYFGVEGEVTRDRVQAYKNFEQAGINEGHPDAAYMAGMMAMLGREKTSTTDNIPKDENQASLLFLTASDQGHAKAQVEAGILYLKGYFNSPFVNYNDDGKVITHNDEQNCLSAKELLEKGVAKGLPRAEYGLGMIYLDGYCVFKDTAKAVELLERAAKKDITEAQVQLTWIYCPQNLNPSCKDFGIAKDREKALKYAQMAMSTDHVIDRELHIVDEENLGKPPIPQSLIDALR